MTDERMSDKQRLEEIRLLEREIGWLQQTVGMELETGECTMEDAEIVRDAVTGSRIIARLQRELDEKKRGLRV
jgi:hypothetical protein